MYRLDLADPRLVLPVPVYDACRSARPYKGPMSHTEARTVIASASGTQFDPAIVTAFCGIPEFVWEALAATVDHAHRCADAIGLCHAVRAGVTAPLAR